jgi:hypothetical protein
LLLVVVVVVVVLSLLLVLVVLLVLLSSDALVSFPRTPLLRTIRRFAAFQRFLMLLSVRPGKSLAISVHWFPNSAWACTRIFSSSMVHGPWLISGLT